jgi:prepilin-type N-terminal cleavage/methylation domain-containing protein
VWRSQLQLQNYKQQHPMTNIFRKGFTLIELLIVIAIVAILTALVTTNLQAARSRARDIRRKSDLRSMEQSLRLYYNDAKSFPVGNDGNDYKIEGCGTIATPATCNWGSSFATTGGNTYMNALPIDPSSADTDIYYRYYSVDGDEYILVAGLENASDQDIIDSQNRCSNIYGSFTDEKDPTKDYVVCGQ